MRCDRCGKEADSLIMSMFNTEMICHDCKEDERSEPRYKEAQDADVQAILTGDFNFPGIGR